MARYTTFRLLLALTASTLVQGCASTFGTQNNHRPIQRQICIHSDTSTMFIDVEIAATHTERKRGLQQRTVLAGNHGMLFEFDLDQSPDHGFWMYRTLIPLDIAYLDRNGKILAIKEMEPCTEARRRDCKRYPPGHKYRYALEVNRGFFTANNINPGALVNMSGEECNPAANTAL